MATRANRVQAAQTGSARTPLAAISSDCGGLRRRNFQHRMSNPERRNSGRKPNIKYQKSNIHRPLSRRGIRPGETMASERFAETAAKISAQTSAQWILFGTQNDAAIGNQIAAAIGDRCVNRIGHTTLDQLINELRECRLLLTNDTGTMHLAALLGVPVVAIFGSTEPALTGPLGNAYIVLRHHVECSPCFLRECPIDFRCMKAVTTEEVVDAVRSILTDKFEI
jgi:ADP-heptose:LPS heptosyltransferase